LNQDGLPLFYVLTFGLLAALWVAEGLRPTTPLRHALARRWFGNAALFACCQAILILLLPAYAAAGAAFAADRGWGLFNHWTAPLWVVVIAALLVCDGLDYVTHRIEHAVPLFWRMHRTHHSDLDLDLTTGLRFHPLEAVIRGGVTALAMMLLGAPPTVVGACTLFTATVSLVSHANTQLLPARIESALQLLLVTPRLHRIHHSLDARECNSNFGAGLSIWDRLLGTYRGQPELPYAQMQFGVTDRTPEQSVTIGKLLLDPVVLS
jgi:sterol desaturase/sphingolipid hydroxylase (fatty acid hydroxylase superfamily)